MRKAKIAVAALAAAFTIALPSIGQDGTGGLTNVSLAKGGVLANVAEGKGMRLEYELEASAWVFIIPITGRASFDVKLRADETYEINSRVRTTGLADVFVDYDMRLGASGYVSPERLQTYSYVSQNNDGKKNRRVELVYGDADVAMTARPAFGNLGEPPAAPPQKLEALDPISALISYGLEPRFGTPEDACGNTMKIFDGRQLTHLQVKYVGMSQVRTKAWRGEAVECHITMDRVAGYKKGEVNNDTLTGVDGPLRMWLAPLPNGSYLPVKIQADTDKIGKVTLEVSKLKFTPLEE